MRLTRIPWQWGALDKLTGSAARSPASGCSSPPPCPMQLLVSSQGLQLNMKDVNKLYHILSLPGASQTINSVSVYSWKTFSSSGMVDNGLKRVANALTCTCTRSQSLHTFQNLLFFSCPTLWHKPVLKHGHQKLLSLHYFPKALLPGEARLR